ncbi:MAG: hypothetical protein HKN61_02400 [Flavobacteriaceae bacterium]|nr:hypothetical protein [Flavobacteriaceae bacterium]
MKTTKFIRLIFYFPMLILGLNGCDPTDSETDPSQGSIPVITFEDNEYQLTENSDSLVLRVKIAPKATADGSLHLKFSGKAQYNQDFTTNPPLTGNTITLPFSQSQEFVTLTLYRQTPGQQEEKDFQLQLYQVPAGFKMGEQHSALVIIAPRPEEMNSVNFEYSSLKVQEDNSEGITVLLKLSQPTKNTEQITLKMIAAEGMEYGTRYKTTPEPTLNELSLQLLPGATSASIIFKPVNDQFLNGAATVKFEISALSTGLVTGDNKSVEVMLEDDDQHSGIIYKLKDVRELFEGKSGDWYFPEDYYVEGVISSDLNVLDNKTIYLQDETAGILLRFMLPSRFKIGDQIRLNLKSATGTNLNGQKSIDQVNPEGSVIIDQNIVVQAEEVTLDQLLSGDYEGKRVRVNNVAFVNADGSRTFLGSRTISDDNRVALVNTYASASFSNTVLPSGSLSISGIVGDWGRLMPQLYSHDIIKN